MKCPICHSQITLTEGIGVCSSGHGTLLTGLQLSNLKSLNLRDVQSEDQDKYDYSLILICPNCSTNMQKVNYNDTGNVIDVCPNCTYRWLPPGYIEKIKNFKPQISPEDAIMVENLDEKTETLDQTENTSNTTGSNSFLNSGWGGFIKGNVAGNERRTYSYLIMTSLVGLFIGAKKYKLVRIIAPFVIIGFIILGYEVFRAAHSAGLKPNL